MGGVRFTVQNLSIQAIDTENNLILVKGALPGSKGSLLLLRTAVKSSTKKGGVGK
jgi:large subunit ribosomal protein L3